MKSRYANWIAPSISPEVVDPTQELIDTPEPDPWTHVEPMFPMNGLPFTPTSACPHRCKLCDGTGSFRHFETDAILECPDCSGSGSGPIPKGAPFVCMVCNKGGKDGTPAFPDGIEPLPIDPEPVEPEPEEACSS